MATKAPDSLFDPDYFKVQIVPVLNIAGPLIEELRNYGLAVLARCAYRPDGGDENLAVLLTYLHLLEMLARLYPIRLRNKAYQSSVRTARAGFLSSQCRILTS
jgi:hypothetical protein